MLLEDGVAAEVVATIFDEQTAPELRDEMGGSAEPMEDQLKRWQLVEDSRQRRRKVAAKTHFEVYPLFLLPTRRHATCAANYLFGLYPSDKSAATLYLGGPRYAAMDAWLKQAFERPQ